MSFKKSTAGCAGRSTRVSENVQLFFTCSLRICSKDSDKLFSELSNAE